VALGRLGRMVFVRGDDDIGVVRLSKCTERSRLRNPDLRAQVVEGILGSEGRRAA